MRPSLRIALVIFVVLVHAGCAAIDRSAPNEVAGASGVAGASQSMILGTAGSSSAGENSVGGSNGGASSSSAGQPGNAGTAGASAEIDGGASPPSFILGADITWTQADVDAGMTYNDGATRDLLAILRDHGFNYVRLRTFVEPRAADGYDREHGYADVAHTITFAKSVKAAGMGFLLDFHYSDNWADPGKQCVPIAWQGFADISHMASALHDYTASTVSALIAAGARPDIVQIGNEITPGMCVHVCNANGYPTGQNAVNGAIANWDNLGALLRAGSNAVKEIDPNIRVMLHLDRGNSLATSRDFIVNAQAQGVSFDVFGESCYTAYQGQPSAWASTFSALASEFPKLTFAIAEYGPEERAANDLLFALPNQQGLGSFVWEPTHTGAWNTGHALFTASGNISTATPDLLLYDQMRTAYASRL